MKAYRKLSRYRAEASFRSWLLFYRRLRDPEPALLFFSRRDGLTLRAAAAEPVVAGGADDGLDAVLAAERRAALVGALRLLPVRDPRRSSAATCWTSARTRRPRCWGCPGAP
ncbi:hypothetical protein MCBG_00384 [Micromonospora sp. M42]|uniref:hypothetical protein n=1 Tax=Micromonospora sp. M42 TaxID=457406 RepID=UPI0003EEC232|nr:hypothetical protein [Micromonospora sp. M42]EWM63251.1 hypothetical protein MCBG_00384 [Micromonospora sp. M42]